MEVKRRRLQQQQNALLVRAQQDGIWVAPEVARWSGAWLERGTALGTLIDDRAFRFTAVVPQDEASSLFSAAIRTAEVRLQGQAEAGLAVVGEVEVIPFQHQKLPSSALGWRGGGEIAVTEDDPEGLQAAEPFFRIEGALPADTAAVLMHGRSGVIRFTLDDRPLLGQWARDLRQLLQRRYQL